MYVHLYATCMLTCVSLCVCIYIYTYPQICLWLHIPAVVWERFRHSFKYFWFGICMLVCIRMGFCYCNTNTLVQFNSFHRRGSNCHRLMSPTLFRGCSNKGNQNRHTKTKNVLSGVVSGKVWLMSRYERMTNNMAIVALKFERFVL